MPLSAVTDRTDLKVTVGAACADAARSAVVSIAAWIADLKDGCMMKFSDEVLEVKGRLK
jgi:hypothetical protein